MTRRAAALFAVFALAGCSGLRDAFTGHQNVVAKVGSHELTAEQLANAIALTKQVPLDRTVLDRVANLWVDLQLVGQAVASGDSMMDSATVAAANWPTVSERLADMLHDTLIDGRSHLSPAQVDSAFNADDARYLYHILVAVRPDTTDAVKAAKLREAQGYLAQLRRAPGTFQQLASRVSEDPGSKPNGGELGLMRRGMLVKPFEDAAFALQPGQISDIVTTPFGYHIIWRPTLAEVRDSFTLAAQQIAGNRLDSLFIDSLTHRAGIRVRGSAPARMREVAADLDAAKSGSQVLATYPGGSLRTGDFARWLQAYPPQITQQIGRAPDSMLTEFVGGLARNDMLLRQARQMGLRLSPAAWDTVRTLFRAQLDTLEAALAVAPESLAADTAHGATKGDVAARHVDEYFDAITSPSSRRPYVEVPPFLADALRDRMRWSVSQAGIDRALERAKEIRGPETPSAQPFPSMTPAPGGPPVGGGAPRARPSRPRG